MLYKEKHMAHLDLKVVGGLMQSQRVRTGFPTAVKSKVSMSWPTEK